MMTSAYPVATIIGILVAALTIASGLIWLERRLLALWQDRYGPNRVGPFGLLQVLADMIKIFFKEDWIPPFADKAVFIIAPAVIVITVLMSFAVLPIAPGIVVGRLNIGLLFFLAMSSLGVYSVVLAGWSSDNKYSLLGAFRAAAQMLSYEVFMGLSLMGVVLLAGSFDLVRNRRGAAPHLVHHPAVSRFRALHDRRSRRDTPTAVRPSRSRERIVAGFHSEYSGMKFGMFFVGEYLGVTLISALIAVLFFGGWLGPVLPPVLWFLLKTFFFICFFILLRASLPRPRFDQLMNWGWKAMLPLVPRQSARNRCDCNRAISWEVTVAMLSILRTIWDVFLHMFHRRVTVQYPEEKPYLAPRYRGRIILSRDPDGGERCVACYLVRSSLPG